MKTTYPQQILQSYIKIVFISLILIMSSLDSSAENPFISFQIARDVTGSGLGGNFYPSIGLNYNKSTLSIGPNFQRRKFNLSGVQANYRYSVATNYNKKLELYFSGNLTFQKSAYMSKENVEIEMSCDQEGTYDYAQLRLKVIEGYAGIGLKFNFTKNLSTAAGAGFGVFDTMNKDYNKEMYRQEKSVAMRMNFILIYNFKTS